MKTTLTEYEQAVADYLAAGNQVKNIPFGESSPDIGQSQWGKSRPSTGAPKDEDPSECDQDDE
jgi:hypothetical protein